MAELKPSLRIVSERAQCPTNAPGPKTKFHMTSTKFDRFREMYTHSFKQSLNTYQNHKQGWKIVGETLLANLESPFIMEALALVNFGQLCF